MKFIQPTLVATGLFLLIGAFSGYTAEGEIPKIENPSFEIGSDITIQGWNVHPGIKEATDRSVRIVKDASVDGEQAVELKAGTNKVDNQWLLQDIPVTEITKKQFVIRAHAKGIGRGQLHVIFYNSESKSAAPLAQLPFSPTEDYLPYDLRVEIPLGTVRMRLHIGALGSGSIISFDKIEIIEVSKISETKKTSSQK